VNRATENRYVEAHLRICRAQALVESIGADLLTLTELYFAMSQAGDANRRALDPIIEAFQAGTIGAVLRSLEARRRSLYDTAFPQEQAR
jgi:hypothetical protein